ncbi:MAG: hypothetical protein U0990_04565 [Candidatus Nanopelagicales bacterium]|nr:hypothetical protein [Candidatus Nanopelagicales bacterium]MDZ4249345.1 hypothetical protein [Candidatus Nanopelagicales bacterium]
MGRLIWVGVGAAGGIYAYRRAERVWLEAKDRGVAGNATILAAATTAMLVKDRVGPRPGVRR